MKGLIKRGLAVVLGACLIGSGLYKSEMMTYAAQENEQTAGQNDDISGNESPDGQEYNDNSGEQNYENVPEQDGSGENNDGGDDQTGANTDVGGSTDDAGNTGEAGTDETGSTGDNETEEEGGGETQPDTETVLKENSWRYQDGVPTSKFSFYARSGGYSKAWQKVNGVYVNSEGKPIEGAVKKGIDVSQHQGKIDWAKVKADGIDYAIIRCGYGDNYTYQDDTSWQYNVSECERLGIPYGVYIYSYATNTTMAKSEAEHVLRLIKGRNLSYPVYFDMEDNSTVNVSSSMKGQIAKTFCDTVTAAGYRVGIYANLNWWTNYLTDSVFNNSSWSKWVAQYNSTCDYNGKYDMWQCTDKGRVSGISGNVDLNFLMDASIDNSGSNGNSGGNKESLVSFAAYMANTGWLETVHNGEDAGLPGASKDLQAFKISIGSGYGDLGVKYSAHVSGGVGWQNYVSNGNVAGVIENGKAMEAVKIELTGNEASKYDIYYRVYVRNTGWMGWAKNGQSAGTEGYSRRIESIQIKIVSKGAAAPGSTDNAFQVKGIKVAYQTYVKGQGWQGVRINGETSGTSGAHLPIEGMRMEIRESDYSGSIVYNTYMQNYGWLTDKSNNSTNGLLGQGLRMEAFKVKLTGDLAKYYDVYYRAHVQNIGWMGWAKNGQIAGTAEYSLRIEAVEVKLVKKGGAAPGSTSNAYQHPLVMYQTHVQFDGWQSFVRDGEISGLTGQSRRLEAINIKIPNQDYTGNIEYRTHVQFTGWQGWKKNGQMSGTSGQSLRLEAIEIKLTGEMAKHYDIYYRTHVQFSGWLGWAKNGGSAGTSGMSRRMEAIQIKIVPKGSAAPGSTSGAYLKQ
ncbi:GH25 family lysozyme [Faecalicatena contorta]|uniref:GH25 family lysozyme n=1 Tax=Faecalicatena contorta TaxID=39482 RepID=UPI002EB3E657|nr:GH25 family lysozyme [Muricomes sp.]